MSFAVSAVGGYGSSTANPGVNPTEQINSYAAVTAITANTITIGSTSGTISQGDEILFHVSGVDGAQSTTYLGKYGTATVSGISGTTLTVDKDLTNVIPANQVSSHVCQIISFAKYSTLTIDEGYSISPPAFDGTKGGIIAIKCATKLFLNGGHIDLTNKGIQSANANLRPLLEQEKDNVGVLNTDPYAGWENSATKDRFVLNVGDGAAFIVAYKLVVKSTSRIGNPTYSGVQYARGVKTGVKVDGANEPNNASNIGGSTILIAAYTMAPASSSEALSYAFVAKYTANNNSKKGLGRCYLATTTKLINDEGLYAYDTISNGYRVKQTLKITSFGDGSDGVCSQPTAQLNNYASLDLTGYEENGTHSTTKFRVYNITDDGQCQFAVGKLVMIRLDTKIATTTTYTKNIGNFILAKITAMSFDFGDTTTGTITFDTALPARIRDTNCNGQVVTIPQYTNFTLTGTNSATRKYENPNGGTITKPRGGIFAVAVSDTCDISHGVIDVEDKGGATAYGANGLQCIGNAQMSNKLPIGAGHGSVFILAQNLIMGASTRIGATYSGARLGGAGLLTDGTEADAPGGYVGGTNYLGNIRKKACGARGAEITASSQPVTFGGYGSNGLYGTHGKQGAHIMIIANRITGLSQAAISTGGQGGVNTTTVPVDVNGGAGYGGGGKQIEGDTSVCSGGYNGGGGLYRSESAPTNSGGGGSSGWAFIYCNEAVDQDTTGTVLE